MENLGAVIKHLTKEIGPDFFGTITIKVRNGQFVHLNVERSIKLDDEPEDFQEAFKDQTHKN